LSDGGNDRGNRLSQQVTRWAESHQKESTSGNTTGIKVDSLIPPGTKVAGHVTFPLYFKLEKYISVFNSTDSESRSRYGCFIRQGKDYLPI
jgi:hypothetical protein